MKEIFKTLKKLILLLSLFLAVFSCTEPQTVVKKIVKQQVATVENPEFLSDGGNYTVGDVIHAVSIENGAQIFYTTNDTDPDATSYEYTTYGIQLLEEGTYDIRIVAYLSGKYSAVVKITVNVTKDPNKVEIPLITAANNGTNINTSTEIEIESETEDATIYYTTDGSVPTTSSTEYKEKFCLPVGNNQVVKAFAVKSGLTDSNVAQAVFNVTESNKVATPVFDPASGTVKVGDTITITCSTSGADIKYSIDNGTYVSGSSFTIKASQVDTTITVKAKATKDNKEDSDVATTTFNVEKSENALLSDLTTSAGSISFSQTTFNYDGLEVDNDEESITVNATLADSSATLQINGSTATSAADTSVDLDEGKYNLIEITVTNGSTIKTYMLIVLREGAGGTVNPYDGVIMFSKNADTIWVWQESNEISVKMGEDASPQWDWFSQPTMTASTDYPGWYEFRIPSSYYQTGKNLSVIFNKGDTKTTDDTKTGWDGSAWVAVTGGSTQWTAPKEPTFTFDPNGGEVASTDDITITATPVEGSIDLKGYLLNGVKVDNLDSFNITEGSTVVAYATNSEGGAAFGVQTFTTSQSKPIITFVNASAKMAGVDKFTIKIDGDVTTSSATFGSQDITLNTSGSTEVTVGTYLTSQGASKTVTVTATNNSGTTTETTTIERDDNVPKPTVTISTKSGEVDGDDTIDITITGSQISAYDATFNSKSISLTVPGTTTITVKDYLSNDGDSGAIEVSATNPTGSTVESGNLTRKDTVVADNFTWDNATVYFVFTDRFENGDTANDNSYGRRDDYSGDNGEIGTFHGGDLKGLTKKVNEGYFDDLGINAIWMTAPYEQIHGFCGGGDNGAFPHFAYHGYYVQDYTMIDKNMGTVEDMRAFVKTAHDHGIRVVMDVVLNHTGYATPVDAVQYNFAGNPKNKTINEALNWEPSNGGDWHGYHDEFYDYNNASSWSGWWGSNWVRAGLPGYDDSGSTELTKVLSYLPDFKTESSSSVSVPEFLKNEKWPGETSGYSDWIIPSASGLRGDISNAAPTDYVVKWLAAWVEEFGIDGFRCDTAKHVDKYRWKQLDNAAETALDNWRNSSRSDNDPAKDWTDSFWMTGEHWNHGVGKDDYYSNGFDSMINFDFQKSLGSIVGSSSLSGIESIYSSYASQINNDSGFNVLSYISSHDTPLFFNCYVKVPSDKEGFSITGAGGDLNKQKRAGTALLLVPGGAQMFYGDEVARSYKNYTTTDHAQGTRTQMDFNSNSDVLAHWQKVGQFRKNHPAVGAGSHSQISGGSGYTFSRIKGSEDKVVVCLGGSGSVNVGTVFTDGTTVRNAYDGTEATVSGGSVTFSGDVILIEEVK